MTEMKVTPEESIARVTVSADTGFLPPLIDFVKQITHRLGLGDAEQVDRAVELVCTNIIEHAFGPEEEGSFDVQVLRRPGLVVVAVGGWGTPLRYQSLPGGEESALVGRT